MNQELLLSYKNNVELQKLDLEIIKTITSLFSTSNIKFKKKFNKKNTNNILKNPKLQNAKGKIENKVNLVLNKLSESNINNLVEEFIYTIKMSTKNEYNYYLKTLYLKIINEINFVNNYLKFMKIINYVYYKNFNLEPEYFFQIIQNKIENDYLGGEIKYDFLNKIKTENYRVSNLILINSLIDNNIVDKKLGKLVNSILINQNYHIPDIFYWFENKTLSTSEKQKITFKIEKNNLSIRDKIMLKQLIDEKSSLKNDINKIIIPIVANISNKFETECNNIIDEYIYLELFEEIKEFILTDCINANSKNIFCQIFLKKYFEVTNVNSNKLINLLKKLIKNKILYKSNLSRGLLLLHKKSSNLNDDKLKKFLLFLKSNGISYGIEFLMKKYNISYKKT